MLFSLNLPRSIDDNGKPSKFTTHTRMTLLCKCMKTFLILALVVEFVTVFLKTRQKRQFNKWKHILENIILFIFEWAIVGGCG